MKIPSKIFAKLYIYSIFFYTYLQGYISLKFNKSIYGKSFLVGQDSKIWGSITIKILGNGFISIGKSAHLVSSPIRSFITLYSSIQLTTFPKGKIIIGDKVALNGTIITSKLSIEIGSGTMVAPNVIIVDSDFHNPWPANERFISSTETFDKPVRIGKNVWIGMNSLILKGSLIGDNSIIAAGSVVVGEIPSDCIAGGNPARVISFNK
jgi:acetyltransferase-like isoleucine patch superfamily enzyme